MFVKRRLDDDDHDDTNFEVGNTKIPAFQNHVSSLNRATKNCLSVHTDQGWPKHLYACSTHILTLTVVRVS